MKTIHGKIEKVSQYGVLIGEDWYNKKKGDTSDWLTQVLVGQTVDIEYEENPYNGKVYRNVTRITTNTEDPTITVTTHETIGQEPTVTLTTKPPGQSGPTIGMTINNACAYVKEETGLDSSMWAKRVVEYAKALLKEMETNGLA